MRMLTLKRDVQTIMLQSGYPRSKKAADEPRPGRSVSGRAGNRSDRRTKGAHPESEPPNKRGHQGCPGHSRITSTKDTRHSRACSKTLVTSLGGGKQ
jgi:hypothetical protein